MNEKSELIVIYQFTLFISIKILHAKTICFALFAFSISLFMLYLYYKFGRRRRLTLQNTMEKIASFTIDHIKLEPGIYVSRKDFVGKEVITTFDLRMTSPNDEPVMNTAEVHTIEHLAATYLRNNEEYKDKVIYFGPMGCRTGFYLLLAGDYESKDILPLITSLFIFIRDFKGDVPGATKKDCGNYLDMNLGMANYLAKRYLDNVLTNIDDAHLNYPE